MSTSKKKTKTVKTSGAVAAKKAEQIKAVQRKIIENPSLSVSRAIREVGMSEYAATHPSTLTDSPLWVELLDTYLPNTDVLMTHRNLLRASRIDHMQFIADGEGIHDADITEMFAELGCTVRKIIHRETGARDVYFWSPDNKARATALDMVYKMRGSYVADKAAVAFSLAALAKLRDGNTLPAADSAPQLEQIPDAPQLPRAV